jgi:hypothetical protein
LTFAVKVEKILVERSDTLSLSLSLSLSIVWNPDENTIHGIQSSLLLLINFAVRLDHVLELVYDITKSQMFECIGSFSLE